MTNNKVYLFTCGECSCHEFQSANEAVKFYQINKAKKEFHAHIELVPTQYEFENFFLPKVQSFNGTFIEKYFVGSLVIEDFDKNTEYVEGVFLLEDLDFRNWAISKLSNYAQQTIMGLKNAHAIEVGRNDNTGQTLLAMGDYMIAVDDSGNVKVSQPMSTWNECLEQVLYVYENPNDFL